MGNKRLPEKPFKVKFKIARFGFTDFHYFVQRFVSAADWKIVDVNESAQTYFFENRWGMALFTRQYYPEKEWARYMTLLTFYSNWKFVSEKTVK